ncbi:MAG: sulfurtransferase [Gammaproteobacteria bacterium]|nr:sulfurtransferase [Gammaproteobacteria bacterium]|tara:strand:+ start:285 stop:1199 length:915 start_codon:yes stop_codon:yes gene_type:complete
MTNKSTEQPLNEYRDQYLISAQRLSERLGESSLRVIDVTMHLKALPSGDFSGVSGRGDYEAGHIPSAVYLDLQNDLSDNTSAFRFTVPSVAQFDAAMQLAGISDTDTVVLYAANHPMWACRVWWLFKIFGHQQVLVLDGGLPAWQAQGLAVSTAIEPVPATAYSARYQAEHVIDGARLAAQLPDSKLCLLNALSKQQFDGIGPHYGRPGHIQGSVSTPYSQFLTNLFCFEDAAALQLIFDEAGVTPDKTVATYCGGGIAAAIPIFALALLGRTENIMLYDHSLSEWAARDEWPMAITTAPRAGA